MVRSLRLMAYLTVVAVTVGACGGDFKGTILDDVPANAVALASIRVKELLDDPKLQKDLDGLSRSSGDGSAGGRSLSFLQDELGLDAGGIDEVLFFATSLSSGSEADDGRPKGVAFVWPAYNRSKVIAALEKKEGKPLRTVSYKGQELLTNVGEDESIFFQGNVLATGPLALLKSVIDVRRGDGEGLPAALRNSFQALGSPLVKAVINMPDGALKELTEAQGGLPIRLPFDLGFVTEIKSLALTVDRVRGAYDLRANLGYADAASAKRGSDALAGLISVFKGTPSGQAGLMEILDKLKVTASSNQIKISGRVTAQELRQNFGAFRTAPAQRTPLP